MEWSYSPSQDCEWSHLLPSFERKTVYLHSVKNIIPESRLFGHQWHSPVFINYNRCNSFGLISRISSTGTWMTLTYKTNMLLTLMMVLSVGEDNIWGVINRGRRSINFIIHENLHLQGQLKTNEFQANFDRYCKVLISKLSVAINQYFQRKCDKWSLPGTMAHSIIASNKWIPIHWLLITVYTSACQ